MDREKVIDAFRNCITEPKCKDCPWESCETYHQVFAIPKDLALEVMKMLVAQVPIEPIQGNDNDGDDIFCCGSCGAVVGDSLLDASGEYEIRFNYCPECGRAVKWE